MIPEQNVTKSAAKLTLFIEMTKFFLQKVTKLTKWQSILFGTGFEEVQSDKCTPGGLVQSAKCRVLSAE